MKNSCKKENGITLMSLVITIVILIILASIATYSGIEVIKSSKLTKFTTEMRIMQTQVNELYQKMQDGDTTIKELGKIISEIGNQTQVNNVFNAVGITTKDEREQYKYFDKDTIKKLNIEGVSGTFFVNIDKRSVISYEGFQYEDKYYYTLEQLPNGLYNVEHEKNTNEPPTFDTNVEKVSEGKWRITVLNINYDGYINKWSVKYKLEDSNNWSTSEDLSFIVNEQGNYLVKIENNKVKSEEKERPVWEDYVRKGMLLYLDGIDNTRKGHDNNTTVWENLIDNKYDFIKLSSAANAVWSENSYKGDGVNRTLYCNQAILENATECTVEVCYDIPKLDNTNWVFQNRESDSGANGFQFAVGNGGRVVETFLSSNQIYKSSRNFKKCTDINGRTMGISLNNTTIRFSDNTEFYSTDADEKYMQLIAERTNYTIGSAYPWQGFCFQGNIYSIRIYDRKLSETEILYNHECDKARFKIE